VRHVKSAGFYQMVLSQLPRGARILAQCHLVLGEASKILKSLVAHALVTVLKK
jgi:hypothetical protein